MLSTVLYYELAMKVPIPVGITVYLLTWGLGHLRRLVLKCIILDFDTLISSFHFLHHPYIESSKSCNCSALCPIINKSSA